MLLQPLTDLLCRMFNKLQREMKGARVFSEGLVRITWQAGIGLAHLDAPEAPDKENKPCRFSQSGKTHHAKKEEERIHSRSSVESASAGLIRPSRRRVQAPPIAMTAASFASHPFG
jgi:hypothetical protein